MTKVDLRKLWNFTLQKDGETTCGEEFTGIETVGDFLILSNYDDETIQEITLEEFNKDLELSGFKKVMIKDIVEYVLKSV